VISVFFQYTKFKPKVVIFLFDNFMNTNVGIATTIIYVHANGGEYKKEVEFV
jgi:hypothetical protein